MTQSTSTSTRTFITPPATDNKKDRQATGKTGILSRKNIPWLVVGVLIVISLFLFWEYHTAQQKLNGDSHQITQLVDQVRKIAVVPANETPTVATVVHANKLQSQTFFANAKDGDKVLVFSSQREAFLYRPSTGQIVNIAPVNVNTQANSSNLSK